MSICTLGQFLLQGGKPYPMTAAVRGYWQCLNRSVASVDGSILLSTLPHPEPPLELSKVPTDEKLARARATNEFEPLRWIEVGTEH